METESGAVRAYLAQRGINSRLVEEVIRFRESHPDDAGLSERVQKPAFAYYGTEVWEMAIAALLNGENILLSGPKATGKNVLAENLAWVFGRPAYNMSFHINTDAASLVGTDSFADNRVYLRRGPVYLCAVNGGFGIFDEINMAKNDAVSVLHASLDHRRLIDVPGYERIRLADSTRFIGTMNYGYAGTKELNEALVSRFMVVDMPAVDKATLDTILCASFPDLAAAAQEQFCGLFLDLQLKALNGEISTKGVDLRGLLGAIKTTRMGLSPSRAIRMGVTNKSFDAFERDIIDDVVLTRIPPDMEASDVFR